MQTDLRDIMREHTRSVDGLDLEVEGKEHVRDDRF